MLPNSQRSQDTELIISMFRSAVRILVNMTTWLWHLGLLKTPHGLGLKMLSASSFQSCLYFLAPPGWESCPKQICHLCHPNNYGLTGPWCPQVSSHDSPLSWKAGSTPFGGGSQKDTTPQDNTLLAQVVLLLFSSTRQHPNSSLITSSEGKLGAVSLLQSLMSGPSCAITKSLFPQHHTQLTDGWWSQSTET